MDAQEPASGVGQKCQSKEAMKDKATLQRKWASEPTSTKRSTFADPEAQNRESLPCGATGGSVPRHKYGMIGNTGKMLPGQPTMGGQGQELQGPYGQGFPRGYAYQMSQQYPQHPQTEQRFLSGAKPQPGLEPHAWPFAGQLPSDELFGHPGHTQPHASGAGRFPRQKSPSLPSSFGQYSQSDSLEESHGKKDQKPKKPGKYICHYCGRACAKPSVLKKHIRSHTGERPYPCVPCGFSFKTKSNLYKHRKSHAHAIKAGLVPFSELAAARAGELDQVSPSGEAEVHSDGEQSTDTDEDVVEGATMLMDKDMQHAVGVEPAYADSAEELPMGAMKVPILIVPKAGAVPSPGMECPPFQDIKTSHHMLGSQAGGRVHSLDDSPSIKKCLAMSLKEKKSLDSDPATQSLNLLSPHSKGSTDSGYFSRSESAEQQISPPNTDVKTYEEIMFGRTWYYRPNSRSRQSITVGMAVADLNTLASLKQKGAIIDMGKLTEDICFSSDVGVSGDPKQYLTGPCQSITGLLEPPSETSHFIRSNSMPTPSPPNLSVPPGIRGSHSVDEMMPPDEVFYPSTLRILRRQKAFEHSGNEAHVGDAMGSKMVGLQGTMPDLATRKRRKATSVGDEEDSPGHCDSSCSGSVEMAVDYEFKGSLDGARSTPTGKGSFHSQSDSFDTCASMCSEDIALFTESEVRKAAGNVISVIQHTNSLSRPNSFEKSESFDQLSYQDRPLVSQYSEQSDNDIYEDALSPESALFRTESMDQQVQSDSDLASHSSSSAAPSPGQPYHIPHKLVRQPNIQVPEIRVTEEPDKPEKDSEMPAFKEPDKTQPHQEEFQLPQRSDTLSQMPSEKLPPKKKRLKLADMEHSSGESSFESTCTSLSRSPSQESNLSHSSSFSMSFDKEEAIKSMLPTKQDDSMASASGPKQSEFLTVPGSGHSSHHQQREMRRSSSEQAPCTLPSELPEMRSKSFDYGSLSSSRQGEVYSSASAMKERRRGFLVRQASLSVYPEAVVQESSEMREMAIKQEEHGSWCAAPGGDVMRSKRGGSGVGPHSHQQHAQYILEQSISEDSLQDEPLHVRPQHYRLQTQGSSSEGEHQEVMNKDIITYPSGPPFIPCPQQGLYLGQDGGRMPRHQLAIQAQQQLQKFHIRSPGYPTHKNSIHDQPPMDTKVETSQMYPGSFSSRSSPLSHPHFASKTSQSTSTGNPMLLQQIQTVFATQNASPQASLPGMLVPVRIHTNVPSFGSVMYTSVSQLVTSHDSGPLINLAENVPPPVASKPPSVGISGGISGPGFNLAHFLGQTDLSALRKSPNLACLNTGIPLSLTSGTVSTTDASSSAVGGKRMLSPTSSLELFFQTKHQKRVKEERMYGQIVKEMSAVELSGTECKAKQYNQSSEEVDESERMSQSPPLGDVPTRISIPVRSSVPQPPDLLRAESFTPPLQIVTVRSPKTCGRDSPEDLDIDVSNPSPQSMASNEGEDSDSPKKTGAKSPVSMQVQLAANHNIEQTLPMTDAADAHQLVQFPSLRTLSKVSWCFLNYTKPNSSPVSERNSVYSSWCVSSYNPNPLNLSTKVALALLRSKQKRCTDWMFTTAALSPPSSGKLVSSIAWKLRFDQLKPELMPVDVSKFGKKMKGVVSWDRSKEEQGEKEVSIKPPTAEPTRIKIFEGGYKSNEDYVYVRGRGRGKYICEECGIRCKKPSMLKKHIRTHTDVRPYVCKYCNFAFKTKGNLTKHMKSKAHMKKCLELGVSMSSVEDTEADEGDLVEEGSGRSEKLRSSQEAHQFSDADDSDGEDLDEDEEDEEDDYDGDSTPKTRSRSTSPQPYGLPAMSITSVVPQLPSPYTSHPSGCPDILGHSSKPPPSLFGYFTTVPSIQITPQASYPIDSREQFQRGTTANRLLAPPSLDDELSASSSDLCTPSRLSSPGLDTSGCPSPVSPSSSPSARRYLSPRRELSPRSGHLSPRRDISPLRHISPKRDIGGGGSYRRDLSPRRGHLSLLSPLSRPSSPGGSRDYKRDLSPRGRHRGMIRPLSPRRGLQHQHLLHQSQQKKSLRTGLQSGLGQTRASANMEMDHLGSSSPDGTRGSPPHQVLFSHLPLHSQLQVRSPFPMIPIGGIQMVHSVPVSATSPLPQHDPAPHSSSSRVVSYQKSTSEDSNPGDSTPPHPLHRNVSPSSPHAPQDPAEEGIKTFTDNFSSLCIDTEGNSDEARSQNTPLHFNQSPAPCPSSESTKGSNETAS
ncbi:transcription factor HIVEP2a [Eucyclogobius newberryi]|uniref:transcription factor HIVEP2a n=1 Tax=Eucyclogobius newberryi TaxID=166745 RepID=UPI003B590907